MYTKPNQNQINNALKHDMHGNFDFSVCFISVVNCLYLPFSISIAFMFSVSFKAVINSSTLFCNDQTAFCNIVFACSSLASSSPSFFHANGGIKYHRAIFASIFLYDLRTKISIANDDINSSLSLQKAHQVVSPTFTG